MITPETEFRFSAIIYKVSINPCVDVPEEVSKALNRQGPIPVKGTLNGFQIKATLVPMGGGRHRLYINGDMRKMAKVGVGDEVQLQLLADTEPRLMPVPERLMQELERNKEAKDVWDRLPPSHRNEILAYLNYLKTPEALERNIPKVIKHLQKRDGRVDR
ncbi:MAG: DUF1905 domain-containing protein [Chloroflexi bacterium]|nr:DUF1905 domain-containing protein [Chloroflexota bacterium]